MELNVYADAALSWGLDSCPYRVCPFKEVLYYFTMATRFDACYAYCRCTNEMECHKLNWLISIHSTALHYNTYAILATQDEGC